MRTLTFLFLTTVFIGCRKTDSLQSVSSSAGSAESVYLTHNENGDPVVAWTERYENELTLFFAISTDNGESFSAPAALALSQDVATHAEGMPKVAFRKDGTIVTAYEKKLPTAFNKYAGAICYRTSQDHGKTWSPEAFLHNDTVGGRSRSYFDIEVLPDGEIGASWLDIKLNAETGGRSVKFSRTDGTARFGAEVLIDSSACQCCRTDVYSDLTGGIHIAYRGLMQGRMGQPIRDMMIATSTNQGLSFTEPMRISQDNWVIDGCPHTGPSLCSSKGGLYSMWFTGGNGTGLYYSFKKAGNTTFSTPELVSSAGRHPQSSAGETRFVMVWEETQKDGKFSSIYCQMSENNDVVKKRITPGNSNAFAPVVTYARDGFLVAFLAETDQGVRMFTTRL